MRMHETNDDDVFLDVNDTIWAEIVGETRSRARERARRIMACFNACEGIATEALENGIFEEILEALRRIKSLSAAVLLADPSNLNAEAAKRIAASPLKKATDE